MAGRQPAFRYARFDRHPAPEPIIAVGICCSAEPIQRPYITQQAIVILEAPMSTSPRPGKKAYLLITLFALLLVLFPFLFWYNTWFGRRLSDAEIERYFADSARPRRAQHALVQIGERMSRNQDV